MRAVQTIGSGRHPLCVKITKTCRQVDRFIAGQADGYRSAQVSIRGQPRQPRRRAQAAQVGSIGSVGPSITAVVTAGPARSIRGRGKPLLLAQDVTGV